MQDPTYDARTYVNDHVLSEVKKEYFPALRNFWFLYGPRVGVIFNRQIEVYGIYLPPVEVVKNYPGFQGYITSIQVGANYRLKSKE